MGCLSKVLIEADDFMALRIFLCPYQCSGKLKCIRRSKRVNSQ